MGERGEAMSKEIASEAKGGGLEKVLAVATPAAFALRFNPFPFLTKGIYFHTTYIYCWAIVIYLIFLILKYRI